MEGALLLSGQLASDPEHEVIGHASRLDRASDSDVTVNARASFSGPLARNAAPKTLGEILRGRCRGGMRPAAIP